MRVPTQRHSSIAAFWQPVLIIMPIEAVSVPPWNLRVATFLRCRRNGRKDLSSLSSRLSQRHGAGASSSFSCGIDSARRRARSHSPQLLQPFVALAAAALLLGEPIGLLEIGFAALVVGLVALGWHMRVARLS